MASHEKDGSDWVSSSHTEELPAEEIEQTIRKQNNLNQTFFLIFSIHIYMFVKPMKTAMKSGIEHMVSPLVISNK